MFFFSHAEPLLPYSDRIVFIELHGEIMRMLLRLEIAATKNKSKKAKSEK